jgi:hypothetical protein
MRPVRMVKIPAKLLGEIVGFIESMQNIVNKDMSFISIAARSEDLVRRIRAEKSPITGNKRGDLQ